MTWMYDHSCDRIEYEVRTSKPMTIVADEHRRRGVVVLLHRNQVIAVAIVGEERRSDQHEHNLRSALLHVLRCRM